MVKSFFDPNWPDLGVLGSYGRMFGVNWVWSLELTIYHCLFSICIPIVLTELAFPKWRDRRWLKAPGAGRLRSAPRGGRRVRLRLARVLPPAACAVSWRRDRGRRTGGCCPAGTPPAGPVGIAPIRAAEAPRVPGPRELPFFLFGATCTVLFFVLNWALPSGRFVPPIVTMALVAGIDGRVFRGIARARARVLLDGREPVGARERCARVLHRVLPARRAGPQPHRRPPGHAHRGPRRGRPPAGGISEGAGGEGGAARVRLTPCRPSPRVHQHGKAHDGQAGAIRHLDGDHRQRSALRRQDRHRPDLQQHRDHLRLPELVHGHHRVHDRVHQHPSVLPGGGRGAPLRPPPRAADRRSHRGHLHRHRRLRGHRPVGDPPHRGRRRGGIRHPPDRAGGRCHGGQAGHAPRRALGGASHAAARR